MQLRDAGQLTLRDPVGDHLDWFNIEQAHAGYLRMRENLFCGQRFIFRSCRERNEQSNENRNENY